MNILKAIGRAFVGLGKGILIALRFAERHGLTDDLVDLALNHVLDANRLFTSNDERREYVVAKLKGQYVSESVARLATEMAVQQWKAHVAQP